MNLNMQVQSKVGTEKGHELVSIIVRKLKFQGNQGWVEERGREDNGIEEVEKATAVHEVKE